MENSSRPFLTILILLFSLFDFSLETEIDDSVVNRIFYEKLLLNPNSKNNLETLDLNEFTKLYKDVVGIEETEYILPAEVTERSKSLTQCFNSSNVREKISDCLFKKLNDSCLSVYDIYELYSLPLNSSIDINIFQQLSIPLLYSVKSQNCLSPPILLQHKEDPSISAVWGYGILFVSIINLCSLVGIIVLPFMKMVFYRLLLIFMVALAVGTLTGSGLLFLIPEAFGLVEEGHDFILKSTTVIGGIYLFYLTERIMKMLMTWRQNKKHEGREKNIYCSIRQRTPKKSESEFKDPSTIKQSGSSCTTVTLLNDENSDASVINDSLPNGQLETPAPKIEVNGKSVNGHHHGGEGKEIATVAWMIIFGDGLHNFIDGLSIGAAFTNSILSGVSVSLACICEELPHELGDFAILLNSGMSLKKALMYNFLSACMCYLGLIVGILLGESTSAHQWIFAIAGGMFLYISLVDMMPEMNAAAESEEAKKYGSVKIFLLQNLGLLTGFAIMLIMALYGGDISFE